MEKNEFTFIRKYRNRKLYCKKRGCYLTAKQLWDLLLSGETFVIFDEKTGKEVSAKTFIRHLADKVPDGYTMTPELAKFIHDKGGLLGVLEYISGHSLKFNVTLDTKYLEALGSKDAASQNREMRQAQYNEAQEKISVTLRAIEAMKGKHDQVTLPAPDGR